MHSESDVDSRQRASSPLRALWSLQPASARSFSVLESRDSDLSANRVQSLSNRGASRIVSWSEDNMIAFASPEPIFSAASSRKRDDAGSWNLVWPIYVAKPDTPNEVLSLIEKDSAVVTVAWAPAEYGAHQLLICTESEVSVWSRFQLLSDQFQTTPAAQIRLPDTVLCKWVAPPVIYHLEKPQETFESIGEKFRPQEMPESQYRDVTISFAFITISSGGVVRWFYKRTSNPTLSVLEHSLNMNVTHADIMFTSYNNAQIAVAGKSNMTNVIFIFSLEVNYKSSHQTAEIVNRVPWDVKILPRTRIEIPMYSAPRPDLSCQQALLPTSKFKMIPSQFSQQSSWRISHILIDRYTTMIVYIVVQETPEVLSIQRWIQSWIPAVSPVLGESTYVSSSGELQPYLAELWSKDAHTEIKDSTAKRSVSYIEQARNTLAIGFTDGSVQLRDTQTLNIVGTYTAEQPIGGTGSTVPTPKQSPSASQDTPPKKTSDILGKRKEMLTPTQESSEPSFVTDSGSIKRRKLVESPDFSGNNLANALSKLSVVRHTPIAIVQSPNDMCLAVLYDDSSLHAIHTAPVVSNGYADSCTDVATRITNAFELSLLRKTDWWDIMATLIALNKCEKYAQLFRVIILLLTRDYYKLSPDYRIGWKRQFERIKSTIYRAAPEMTTNFTNSQIRLLLTFVIETLESFFRGHVPLRTYIDRSLGGDIPEAEGLHIDVEPSRAAQLVSFIDWAYKITYSIVRSSSFFIVKYGSLCQNFSGSSSGGSLSQYPTPFNISTSGEMALQSPRPPSAAGYAMTSPSPFGLSQPSPGGLVGNVGTPGADGMNGNLVNDQENGTSKMDIDSDTVGSATTPGSAVISLDSPKPTLTLTPGATAGGNSGPAINHTAMENGTPSILPIAPKVITPGGVGNNVPSSPAPTLDVRSPMAPETFVIPSYVSQMEVIPATIEEFFAVCGDEMHYSALGGAFIFEPDVLKQVKTLLVLQAAVLTLLPAFANPGNARASQCHKIVLFLNKLTDLFDPLHKETPTMSLDAIGTAIAEVTPTAHSSVIGGSITVFQAKHNLMAALASLYMSELSPPRLRFLELNMMDRSQRNFRKVPKKPSGSLVPADARDVLTFKLLSGKDDVRICSRCNRFSAVPVQPFDGIHRVVTWSTACPICAGPWHFLYSPAPNSAQTNK